MSKKTVLFRRGVEAAESIRQSNGVYFCPLCLKKFTEADLNNGRLTLEHVPPKYMSGRAILLTCKGCNNSTGSELENQLKQRRLLDKQSIGIVSKIDGEYGHVFIDIAGERVSADLRVVDGQKNFLVSRKNNPRVVERFFTQMCLFKEGDSFNLLPKATYNRNSARLADLKISFLILFAKFGYSFALSSVGSLIRKILLERRSDPIPMSYLQTSEGNEKKGMILLDREKSIVAVCIHDYFTLIPINLSIASELSKRNNKDAITKLSGLYFPLPTTIEAMIDFGKIDNFFS